MLQSEAIIMKHIQIHAALFMQLCQILPPHFHQNQAGVLGNRSENKVEADLRLTSWSNLACILYRVHRHARICARYIGLMLCDTGKSEIAHSMAAHAGHLHDRLFRDRQI